MEMNASLLTPMNLESVESVFLQVVYRKIKSVMIKHFAVPPLLNASVMAQIVVAHPHVSHTEMTSVLQVNDVHQDWRLGAVKPLEVIQWGCLAQTMIVVEDDIVSHLQGVVSTSVTPMLQIAVVKDAVLHCQV